MRRLSRLFTALATTLAICVAGAPSRADLPPLIDRALLFGDPEISGAQLSPDGRHMSFIKPYRDVRNVWVKGLDQPFDAARPVTADERPVAGYFWSEDGQYILYVQDKGGNEDYHVYAVDPSAAPTGDKNVPPARDLTPLEKVRAFIYAVPEERPDEIIVGLNDRDPAYHDVYRVKIATGERELLIRNEQKVGAWMYDRSGNVRLAYRQKEDGGNEILRVEGQNLVPIYDVSYLESTMPVGFTPDQKRLYLSTNKGDDVDLSRLVILDPTTGAIEPVESDPEKEVDFGGAAFDRKTHELLATYYVGDRVRIYPKTAQARKDLERMKKQLPSGDFNVGSATRDMRYMLVSVSSDVEPGATYLYDRAKGTFTLQYRIRDNLPRQHLATMKPIRYRARDGLMIPAYLTLPKGVPGRNLPVVIHPHGGPWSRDAWGYDPYVQFLANRGYAVLQPNFRSSTGYGKAFINAGNKQWGTGAMQHDLTDGVRYLIEQGIADPKRIAIFGGSYGGYATLAGVTMTPDLYACAVPYVAPSSLITLIESFPAYWRPFLKGSWYLRVGDPADPADREDLLARSPIRYIDRIRVPMLVLHGANDPRVKQAESDAIVVALRDKGHDVEYIVAPDEGHGFRAPDNRMASAVALERFLAKHLKGRAQRDVPSKLEEHLASITVDVSTVKLAKGPDAESVALAKTAPLPTLDGGLLQPTALEYAIKMEAGGQAIAMSVKRTVEETKRDRRECWRVTDTVTMPQGTMTDAFDLDRKSLAPVAREAAGMATVKLTYLPGKISGEIGAGGQTVPVDHALEAPVLGDGPGFAVALAGLPLADGYQTTYRLFDPNQQRVRLMSLKVTGKQQVTVPAGVLETWVVEVEPLDGDQTGKGTYHLSRESPHHVVQAAVKLPAAMGGGTMETQLTSSVSAVKTGR